ncbi:MAG: hypothetical protein LBR60_08465 [Fibrobacter sp.]|jgi:predicted small secreted protein|nr:hypothetical protein [Fibrobacter sp.]
MKSFFSKMTILLGSAVLVLFLAACGSDNTTGGNGEIESSGNIVSETGGPLSSSSLSTESSSSTQPESSSAGNKESSSSIETCMNLKIGEVTEIRSGETACNTQYDLSLQVENVSDGRCPGNVTCVWEGNASVEFRLTSGNEEHRFTLDTNPKDSFKNDTIIDGFRFRLKDVSPYPEDLAEQMVKTAGILVEPEKIALNFHK